MRTKTLVFSAVALAAGLLSSSAQSNVFSANVVGYVNVPVSGGGVNQLIANPLDNGTNDLNSLVGTLPSKSTAQLWNGNGFTTSTKSASGWSPDPVVPVGTGFFIAAAGSSVTNTTFVGNVIVGPGGSVTNNLSTSTVLVGSPIPYADDINGTNILLSVLPAKSTVQLWNGNGFSTYTKGASAFTPDTQIGVAQGFFISAHSATAWVQSLPSQ